MSSLSDLSKRILEISYDAENWSYQLTQWANDLEKQRLLLSAMTAGTNDSKMVEVHGMFRSSNASLLTAAKALAMAASEGESWCGSHLERVLVLKKR